MEIKEFLLVSKYDNTWEEACSGWFGVSLHHILESTQDVNLKRPISELERKELILSIVDQLLSEERIVFEVPGRDWGKAWQIWHADQETIMQRLRNRWPDLNGPDYKTELIDYTMSDNAIAWIGRGTEWFEKEGPGALYADGTCVAGPGEWT
ncbi:MAG: hypothetical protein ACYCY0_09280 [Acidithiobacillus ferrivorans]